MLNTLDVLITKREALTKRPAIGAHSTRHEPSLLRVSFDWKTVAHGHFGFQQTRSWSSVAERQMRDRIGEFSSVRETRRECLQ